MADNSPNPLDDERFHDISASTADADETAEEGLAKGEAPQKYAGIPGRNGYHSFSGPLSPLGVSSLLKEGVTGKTGGKRQLLPIILAVIGVIVILSCLGVGTAVTVNLLSVQGSLNSPQTTIDAFYGALRVKDYQTAYNQLSSSYQSRLTESSFRATFELIGTVDDHQVNNIQTQNDQATVTVEVTLAKPDGGTVTETKTIQLVQENGNWKIDRVNPSLTRVIWFVGQPTLALDWG